ncbi:Vnx1 protein [Saccharomycopsis crataegensis]|uniref:Vnx1 protein n=1 Tax=Saccharomycopsis crataegensis TaxID=43959 RepID=A0AAV5QTB7_9ASCO|nr:Vnx1 protein [Saccharomycopsis crataegensis]
MSPSDIGSKKDPVSQASSPILQPQTSKASKADTYNKQFVLLQPKTKPVPSRNPSTLSNITTTNVPVAAGGPPSSRIPSISETKKKKLQKMPITPSKSRFIFSVDDGEDEIEQDLEREYLEGYNDALRGKLRKKISKNPMALGITSPKLMSTEPMESSTKLTNSTLSIGKNIQDIEQNIAQNLIKAEDGLKELEAKEDDVSHHLDHSIDDLSSNSHHINLEHYQMNHQPQDDMDYSMTAESVLNASKDESGYPEYEPVNEDPLAVGDTSNLVQDGNDEMDTDSISSMESFTLRERQDAINTTHPFGIRIWKPAIYKKFRSVQKEADMDIHEEESDTRIIPNSVYIGNVLWSLTFGLVGFILCLVGSCFSVLCFSWSNRSIAYARLYWRLGFYLLYPFGKVIYLYKDEKYLDEDSNEGTSINEYRRWISNDQEAGFLFTANGNQNEARPLLDSASENNSNYQSTNDDTNQLDENEAGITKLRFFGRGQWSIGRICFFLYFYLVLQPVLFIISSICWLTVFPIPMAKVITILCSHIRQRPLALFIRSDKNNKILNKEASVLVCTYRASGLHYYKYTVDGTNVIILNLMAMVLFVIIDFYVFKEMLGWEVLMTDSLFIFVICLLSIIPLAYFIGQAVASISAQSSMGVGAVINAFFSTVVEIYLYCVALDQQKGLLVEGSMIGSVLGAVLLLPGLSMCAGAIKRKTQRYNPRSAGVSSTMLLFSTVVMFSPTIFHQVFGSYEVTCIPCDSGNSSDFSIQDASSTEPLTMTSLMTVLSSTFGGAVPDATCQRCHITQPPLRADKLYLHILKPFSIFVVVVLFFSYGIALWFTLRTHAALIWQTPTASESKGIHYSVPGSSTLQPIKTPRIGGLKSPSVLSLNDPIPGSTISSSRQQQRRVSNAVNIANKSRKQNTTSQPYEGSLADITSPPIHATTEVAGGAHEEASGGHDAPNWSKTKSTVILLGATVLYAVIAEILVDCVDVVLQQFPISAKFLGLTVFALVPNSTEFLNAISFAMHGNVALSMEIGSAYVLQVLQLQIPSLVIYSMYRLACVPASALLDWDLEVNMLTLIFSRWDCIASVISVYIFTYIYAEGKSNYFKGSLLILMYLVVMLGFYYSGEVDPTSFMH